MLNPVTLIPGLNQPRNLNVEGHRDEIKRLFTGFVDDHEKNLTIGATSSPQPHIVTARGMQTLCQGPIVRFDQIRPLDLTTVFKGKGIVAFALYQQGTLVRVGYIVSAELLLY